MQTELVVLVDRAGRPIGQTPKSDVHHGATPLHLAFSVHIFDAAGRVLLTRRALSKRTWPGVWTNSCCGHPGIAEPLETAVRRRVRQELDLELGRLRMVLPEFAYRAEDAGGMVENEICPVFTAQSLDPHPVPRPDPGEVMDFAWCTWGEMAAAMAAAPFAFSPWAVQQVSQLGTPAGPDHR